LAPLREITGVAFVQFFTLHSALLTPVPGFLFPIPDVAFSQQVIHSGVCQKVPVKNHQIRVKIDQKGDVFRQKGIKKARISSCPS